MDVFHNLAHSSRGYVRPAMGTVLSITISTVVHHFSIEHHGAICARSTPRPFIKTSQRIMVRTVSPVICDVLFPSLSPSLIISMRVQTGGRSVALNFALIPGTRGSSLQVNTWNCLCLPVQIADASIEKCYSAVQVVHQFGYLSEPINRD